MDKIKNWWVAVCLVLVFFIRFGLSLTKYNADINNHQAWMESVRTYGWHGLYERDMEPRAAVNYPPLTLYTFYLGEKVYEWVPLNLQTENVHAAMYKFPSLIADCLVAWLIWRYTSFKNKTKLLMMSAYLLNPALAYNSIWWGQIESLVTAATIVSLVLFATGKPQLGIIAFTVSLLIKQNALPLVPIILFALYLTRPPVKKVIGGVLVSASIFFLSYVPLVPINRDLIKYSAQNYVSSIGGQSHQHQSTVNALNFWYLLGKNYAFDSEVIIGDTTARQMSLGLTAIGVFLALAVGYKERKDLYKALFLSTAVISMWTFVFTTRMHERHGYMMIAYLTMLIPYMRNIIPYLLVSMISFYNLYAVWEEMFYYNWGVESWNKWTKSLALITVLSTLSFPLWLNKQSATAELLSKKRIKTKVVNRRKS